MVINSIEFRAELKKRMTELSLRNKDLAEKTGYSVHTIDCVTSGYHAKISDKLAATIIEVLDMPEHFARSA